jgi:hypothetical protein
VGRGDPVAEPEAAMTANSAALFKAARVLDVLLAALVVVAFS